MISLSAALKTARLQLIATALDAGASPGVFDIYTGPQPAAGEAVVDQVALVSVPLQSPVGAVDAGKLTFSNIAEAMALETGEAVWARATDGDGGFVFDMAVGVVGSGADLVLSTTSIVAGGLVKVSVASIAEA